MFFMMRIQFPNEIMGAENRSIRLVQSGVEKERDGAGNHTRSERCFMLHCGFCLGKE